MSSKKEFKKHFLISKNGKAKKFTTPFNGGSKNTVPERNRDTHGKYLKSQLNSIKAGLQQFQSELVSVLITFEGFENTYFKIESLADAGQGIELLNVQIKGNKTIATVLFPIKKISVIEKKIEGYMSYKQDKNGDPRDNQKLIDAIADIRKASLNYLWSDTIELELLDSEKKIWFEIWLPVLDDRETVINDFKRLAKTLEIQVSEDEPLKFPERSVLLVKSSIKKLSSSTHLITKIAEFRKQRTTAVFFDDLDVNEQREWCDDLLERTHYPVNNPPYVCILDTGVNIGHPLLAPVSSVNDLFTVEPNWGVADDNGHGTAMAGLAIWGDLADILADQAPIQIKHRLESAKLLRYAGDNEGKHLGNITSDGITNAEIANPYRTRVFAMALSSTGSRDRGKPSTWSAMIDSLTSDFLGENLQRRLMFVCAGNIDKEEGSLTNLKNYSKYNELCDIHDPGQSWNSLTVGAYTNKADIRNDGDGYAKLLAPVGGLSPHSTTSVTWSNQTPIKPEIVFEGGNMGVDKYSATSFSSLQLLSTHHEFITRLFSTFNGTSAATALAAKFAAEIYAEYPDLWPETVRALMVHSADWTKAMKSQFEKTKTTEKAKAQYLVRVCGYGVPNINKALWSLNNSVVMVVEDELQPFEKPKGKNVATRDMHLHDLPWPKEQLEELEHIPVKMTVTLSYFIEPNPSSRNISRKYSYASHQLRFDVRRPTESVELFEQRINRAARDEEEGWQKTSADDPNWLFGIQFRTKGSIHKDVWTGTAADLASRGQLAIYPAMGWWKTRNKLERFNKTARYSLIVSIEVPEVDVDIYSSVELEIKNKILVEIS